MACLMCSSTTLSSLFDMRQSKFNFENRKITFLECYTFIFAQARIPAATKPRICKKCLLKLRSNFILAHQQPQRAVCFYCRKRCVLSNFNEKQFEVNGKSIKLLEVYNFCKGSKIIMNKLKIFKNLKLCEKCSELCRVRFQRFLTAEKQLFIEMIREDIGEDHSRSHDAINSTDIEEEQSQPVIKLKTNTQREGISLQMDTSPAIKEEAIIEHPACEEPINDNMDLKDEVEKQTKSEDQDDGEPIKIHVILRENSSLRTQTLQTESITQSTKKLQNSNPSLTSIVESHLSETDAADSECSTLAETNHQSFFACLKCPTNKFINYYEYRRHDVYDVHQSEIKIHHCEDCISAHSSLKSLDAHILLKHYNTKGAAQCFQCKRDLIDSKCLRTPDIGINDDFADAYKQYVVHQTIKDKRQPNMCYECLASCKRKVGIEINEKHHSAQRTIDSELKLFKEEPDVEDNTGINGNAKEQSQKLMSGVKNESELQIESVDQVNLTGIDVATNVPAISSLQSKTFVKRLRILRNKIENSVMDENISIESRDEYSVAVIKDSDIEDSTIIKENALEPSNASKMEFESQHLMGVVKTEPELQIESVNHGNSLIGQTISIQTLQQHLSKETKDEHSVVVKEEPDVENISTIKINALEQSNTSKIDFESQHLVGVVKNEPELQIDSVDQDYIAKVEVATNATLQLQKLVQSTKLLRADIDNSLIGKTISITLRDELIFKCTICRKLFPDIRFLKLHRLHKHNVDFPENISIREMCNLSSKKAQVVNCTKCEQNFSTTKRLQKFIPDHTVANIYDCVRCSGIFRSHGAFIQHMKTCFIWKKYKCHHCTARFRTKISLQSHLVLHFPKEKQQKKRITCFLCEKSFENLRAVQLHMMVDHERRENNQTYKCRQCPDVFRNTRLFGSHFKAVHISTNIKSNHCAKFYKKS